MIRIDDSLLQELGLINLPKEERDALLRHIYETLEMRVGMRLAERMSDQQLDEFEAFLPDEQAGTPGDDAGALKWLETNFPDYKQVVADELDKLKAEIKKDSAQIVESVGAQAPQPADNVVSGNFDQAPAQPPVSDQPQPPVESQTPPQDNVVQGDFGQQPSQPQQYTDQNQQPPMAA